MHCGKLVNNMKIQYSHTLPVSRKVAFNTILNPDSLKAAIPGCDSFEKTGTNCYSLSMKVQIGAVKGIYTSTVNIIDIDAPNSLRMIVSGKGSGGTVRGDGIITFHESGQSTEILINGDAQVTGIIARVGQRLMGGASKTLLKRFFNSLVLNK